MCAQVKWCARATPSTFPTAPHACPALCAHTRSPRSLAESCRLSHVFRSTPHHSLPVCFAQVAVGLPYGRSQAPSSGWEGLRLPSAGHTCLRPLRVPHRRQAGSWQLSLGVRFHRA